MALDSGLGGAATANLRPMPTLPLLAPFTPSITLAKGLKYMFLDRIQKERVSEVHGLLINHTKKTAPSRPLLTTSSTLCKLPPPPSSAHDSCPAAECTRRSY